MHALARVIERLAFDVKRVIPKVFKCFSTADFVTREFQ